MVPDIEQLLRSNGGVLEYAQLVDAVGAVIANNVIRRGRLQRVFPRVYAAPGSVEVTSIRDAAAVLSVGGDAAVSGPSALRRWQLPTLDDPRVNVIVCRTSRPRSRHPDLVVHRTKLPTESVLLDGVATQTRPHAIAWAWVELKGAARRAPAIAAVQRGDVLADEIRLVARQAIRMNGRKQLIELCDVLEAGCHSELEIWGYQNVFDVPDLRGARRQRPIRVDGRLFYLDLAYEAERVAVELDGRQFHSSPEQWERDIRRDLALATVGWQTVRLSHRRLTTDVDGCRRDVLRVLAARR